MLTPLRGSFAYTGGFTARISKISPNGVRTTVIGHLPSSQTSPATGGDFQGVADVVFIDGTLYGMQAGAGCSHGLLKTNNTIYRVNPNCTRTNVADLSAFLKANPVANPSLDDFEPDGTWYGMVQVHDVIYASEPNHQELVRITRDGKISRVVDLSTMFVPPSNWQGPTGIVFHNGNFYIGTLGTFPVRPGTQNLYKIMPDGKVTVAASGLNFPTAMTIDTAGDELYVANNGFGVPTPGSGQIVRINLSGTTAIQGELPALL